MTEQIKLITSGFSPYGHRVEATLIEKNIPYEKKEINLANKPDWFVKDSPLGKIPLLYVGDKPLFESIAICEYLDESFSTNSLHSNDPYTKAWHRAWIEFSNGVLASIFGMIFASEKEAFNLKKLELMNKLEILNRYLKFTPYFEGEKFHLIDICFASAFKPLCFIDNKFTLEVFDPYKNLYAYIESVITRNSITKAIPQDYDDLFKSFLERKKSYLLTMSFVL